jgi:hypothetical protein
MYFLRFTTDVMEQKGHCLKNLFKPWQSWEIEKKKS